MSLATSTVKCILLVFNFIFALSSLGICFLGFILYSKAATLRDVTGGQLAVLSSVLIVTGAIVFFVAFFGCCGVVRESHCMIVFVSIQFACPRLCHSDALFFFFFFFLRFNGGISVTTEFSYRPEIGEEDMKAES
ncbi:tetraspanin-18-like [Diaphorina citri]|uniref:Tetraspanin-18-like n=1 Tax=Diaphorina citri TaxID=121845 RepID=A0A3Q0JKX6_DIACI|nr:tetraspanin-18-like [Diaphorina citri]